MDRSVSQIVFSSDFIFRFVCKHPVDWRDRDLTNRNGLGDKLTPEPMMAAFLRYLHHCKRLFSWVEFGEELENDWAFRHRWWWNQHDYQTIKAVRRRGERNIYPSAIDSLHAQALIMETGWYDSCLINSDEDAMNKRDMLLRNERLGVVVSVGLRANTKETELHRLYKLKHRNHGNDTDIEILVPIREGNNSPGNKGWLTKSHIAVLDPYGPVVAELFGKNNNIIRLPVQKTSTTNTFNTIKNEGK